MNQTITVTADVTAKDEFALGLYHTYTSLAGYSGILISVCAVFAFFYTWSRVDLLTSLLLVFCAFLFLVVKPVTLYFHANKKVKSERMLGPITYAFSDDGIVASQGEKSMEVMYGDLFKVKEFMHVLLIYTEKRHALLLPERAAENSYIAIKRLLRKKARNASVRVRL